MHRVLLAVFVAHLAGCVAGETGPNNRVYVVTYYDRNHDGIVDLELHHLPGGADTDWALIDTRFSGHYDKEILMGIATQIRPVFFTPVPRNVPITSGRPPVWIPPELQPKA
jgi:hypothetical protein